MAKTNKFIHFKTRSGFNTEVVRLVNEQGNSVSNVADALAIMTPASGATSAYDFWYYTVFIADTQEIFSHGVFYDGRTIEGYDELVSQVSTNTGNISLLTSTLDSLSTEVDNNSEVTSIALTDLNTRLQNVETDFVNTNDFEVLQNEVEENSLVTAAALTELNDKVVVAEKELDKWSSTSVGSNYIPVYFNNGVVTACNVFSTQSYGTKSVAYVSSDGVMEVGKYIDFHTSASDGDYSTRVVSVGANSNIVFLPTSSGTLALTTDTVSAASAGVWATWEE